MFLEYYTFRLYPGLFNGRICGRLFQLIVYCDNLIFMYDTFGYRLCVYLTFYMFFGSRAIHLVILLHTNKKAGLNKKTGLYKAQGLNKAQDWWMRELEHLAS